MAESVYIPLPVQTVVEAAEQPSKTYRLDLDKGRILGMVDGQEAVQQAIRKAMITPRWKCLIYDNQYGSEIEASIIQSRGTATHQYVEAVIPGLVRDALRPDRRITSVGNFAFKFSENDEVIISFDANTIYGTVKIEGMVW